MKLGSWLERNCAGRPVYLVGIKGQGVSALARVLAESGVDVVGSDVAAPFATDYRLEHPRIRVLVGFNPENVPASSCLLIHSAGYGPDNPEIALAVARGVDVASYPEFLGRLTRVAPTVCVAGAHGKTTTCQMTGHLLRALGLGPAVIAGGGAVHVGEGEVLVLEACEFRRHFLNYRPTWTVVTNVEWDHPDTYADLGAVEAAFQQFVSGTAEGGTLIVTDGSPGAGRLRAPEGVRRVVCGLGERAEVRGVVSGTAPCVFGVEVEGRAAGTARMQVPGMHNVYNALQALAVVRAMELDVGAAVEALATYRPVERRQQRLGTVGRAVIYDDFAHHPSEIRASLKVYLEMKPARLVVVFQPHTFTRTRALLHEFAAELGAADDVVLTPIFGSVRERSGDVSSEELAALLPAQKVRTMPVDEVLGFIRGVEGPGVVVVFMGCGDIGMEAREMISAARDAVPEPDMARPREG